MKVLLLNPPGPFCRAGSRWPHSRRARKTGIDYHPFPFYLAYATARLQTDGHDARLLDCVAEAIGDEALRRIAADFRPDVVFMETSAPSFTADVETMKALGCPAIAGGPHATATVPEHLESGFAAVIRGEYDQVITEAVALEPRPWLATAGQPDATHAPLPTDLDSIPPPPWEQMQMDLYNDPICLGRSVTVLSTRGCPFRCEFCTIKPYHGKANYRMRSPESVGAELAELVRRYKPDELYFDDDSITINRDHVLGLCAELRRRDFGLPFCCMGNATVEGDVLEAMAKAGCRAFKFGVESGDPEVLRRIPKEVDLDDVERTVRDCRRLGIKTHGTFLLGLPGENRESALRTIDFALRLRTHTLQFAIATPYPGTALFARAQREGWLTKQDWRDFDPAGEAVLSYPGYSCDDIAAMHDLAWRRWQWHILTHQPGTVLHHYGNAIRREGLAGLFRIARYSVSRVLPALRASQNR